MRVGLSDNVLGGRAEIGRRAAESGGEGAVSVSYHLVCLELCALWTIASIVYEYEGLFQRFRIEAHRIARSVDYA